MSDWQVGDLAVCVDDRINPRYPTMPLRLGCAYRVKEVLPPFVWGLKPNANDVGLEFEELRSGSPHGWASERFRKVRPDKLEACEEEFVTLLRKKPVRVPVVP